MVGREKFRGGVGGKRKGFIGYAGVDGWEGELAISCAGLRCIVDRVASFEGVVMVFGRRYVSSIPFSLPPLPVK